MWQMLLRKKHSAPCSCFCGPKPQKNVFAGVHFAKAGENKKMKGKKHMKRILIMTTIVMSAVMTSCNVTRVVTNESQYLQKGDTSIVIQTKTVETYDASKKN